MDEFYAFDPLAVGSKGLIFLGDDLLVYRRDQKTDLFPLYLDLPGGGPLDGETPFETFQREVFEEFGLTIKPEHVVYVRKYESTLEKGMSAYFPVAKLPAHDVEKIRFGSEGLEYLLLSVKDYITRDDAWPIFQTRTRDYMNSVS